MVDQNPPSSLTRQLHRLAETNLRRIFAEYGGTADAIKAVRAELATDTVFRDALACELLDGAIRAAVKWAERRVHTPRSAECERVLEEINATIALMDLQLATGRKLKDATRRDLLEESAEEFDRSRTHLARAKWLKAIAAALPDDRARVGACLTEHNLKELQLRTRQFGLGDRPFSQAVGSEPSMAGGR